MSDTSNSPDHVTIIKESGSGGTILVGIIIAVAIAIGAYLLIGTQTKVDPSDASVAAAADKVGAAAEKIGDAAQDAADKVK